MPRNQVGSYFCDALVRYLRTNTSITTSAVVSHPTATHCSA